MGLFSYLRGSHCLPCLLFCFVLGGCGRGNYALRFRPAPTGGPPTMSIPPKILTANNLTSSKEVPVAAPAGPSRRSPRAWPARRVGLATRHVGGLLLQRACRLPAQPSAAAAHPAANSPGQDAPLPRRHRSRSIAALLAFFLGGTGAHLFYLGYYERATFYLVSSSIGAVFLLLGFASFLSALFGSGAGFLALLLIGSILLAVISLLATADLIAILTGYLKPRDGVYNHEFFQLPPNDNPPGRP